MKWINGKLARTAVGVLFGTLGGISVGSAASAGTPPIHAGTPVSVGEGTARVIVVEDGGGKPASISVILSEKALQGLPKAGGKGYEEFEYILPMPKSGPKTGYDHVVVDWNPNGHPPQSVYTVPHFDFHLYTIDPQTRMKVTFKGPDAIGAATAPAADLLPAGYVVPPDTAVEQMGVHGVDPSGPEFHGKPFTATFIYGYYKGEMTFVEPMVSKAFLEAWPDVTYVVKTPKAYSRPGYYPTRFRVAYDMQGKNYVVALTRLQAKQMD